MDDFARNAGGVAGLGIGGGILLMAWRAYNDPYLTWFVVGGGMGCAFCLCAAFALHQFRRTRQEDRAASTSAQEGRLTTAKVLQVTPQAQLTTGPQDLLTTFIAGMPQGEVVDADVKYQEVDR